jgi:hypothetical protein
LLRPQASSSFGTLGELCQKRSAGSPARCIGGIALAEVCGAAFGVRQSLDTVGALLGPLLSVGLMLLWANDIRAVLWVPWRKWKGRVFLGRPRVVLRRMINSRRSTMKSYCRNMTSFFIGFWDFAKEKLGPFLRDGIVTRTGEESTLGRNAGNFRAFGFFYGMSTCCIAGARALALVAWSLGHAALGFVMAFDDGRPNLTAALRNPILFAWLGVSIIFAGKACRIRG